MTWAALLRSSRSITSRSFTYTACRSLCKVHSADTTMATPFGPHNTHADYARSSAFIPKHMHVRVLSSSHLVPEQKLYVRVTHTVQALPQVASSAHDVSGATPSILKLDAVGVHNVEVEKNPCIKRWWYDGSAVSAVLLGDAAGEPCEHSITVSCVVDKPIEAGLLFSSPDDQYPERTTYVISDHECERARYWLPCVDAPQYRPTVQWDLYTNVAEWRLLGNGQRTDGKEMGESVAAASDDEFVSKALGALGAESAHRGDQWFRASYQLDDPCPSYLLCFAMGEFSVAKEAVQQPSGLAAHFEYYGPKDSTPEVLLRSFDCSAESMEFLKSKLGSEFPYAGYPYRQIALPKVGGAMENITVTTWDSAFLSDERYKPEFGRFVDCVNVHEMTHSYFGDSIGMRHFEHAWLKEAWAMYMEAEWLHHKYGADEFQYEMHRNRDLYFAECERYKRAMVTRFFPSSWSMFDQHLYPGGAWRLHMLRSLLGDDMFWSGVQDYVRTYSKQLVETDQFRRKLENATSNTVNLNAFFDEFVLSPGYPEVKATYEYDGAKNSARIVLAQEEGSRQGDAGVCRSAVFTIPIDVEIVEQDGSVHSSTLHMSPGHPIAAWNVSCKSRPVQVRLDPKQRILFSLGKKGFNPGEDMLVHVLTDGRGVSGDSTPLHAAFASTLQSKLDALTALCAADSPSAMRSLQDVIKAYSHEWHYGLRIHAASLLEKCGLPLARSALVELLEQEHDVLALAGIAKACQGRHPAVYEAVLSKLQDSQELPYRGRAALLEALGAQRHPSSIELLEAELHTEDNWNGVVPAGAARGLGALGTSAACQLLMKSVPYGALHERARPAAIDGLASAYVWQPDHVRHAIRDALVQVMLNDPDDRVRRSAFSALSKVGAEDCLDDMERFKALIPAQDYPWHQRLVLKTKQSGPEKAVKEMEEKLAELTKKLGSVQEDVAKLQ